MNRWIMSGPLLSGLVTSETLSDSISLTDANPANFTFNTPITDTLTVSGVYQQNLILYQTTTHSLGLTDEYGPTFVWPVTLTQSIGLTQDFLFMAGGTYMSDDIVFSQSFTTQQTVNETISQQLFTEYNEIIGSSVIYNQEIVQSLVFDQLITPYVTLQITDSLGLTSSYNVNQLINQTQIDTLSLSNSFSYVQEFPVSLAHTLALTSNYVLGYEIGIALCEFLAFDDQFSYVYRVDIDQTLNLEMVELDFFYNSLDFDDEYLTNMEDFSCKYPYGTPADNNLNEPLTLTGVLSPQIIYNIVLADNLNLRQALVWR